MNKIADLLKKYTGIDRQVSLQFYLFSRLAVAIVSILYFYLTPLTTNSISIEICYLVILLGFILTIISSFISLKLLSTKLWFALDLILIFNSLVDWFILYFALEFTNINPRLIIHTGFIIVFYYSFYRPFLNRSIATRSNFNKYFINLGYAQIIPLSLLIFYGSNQLNYSISDLTIIFLTLLFAVYFLNLIQVKWTLNEFRKEQLNLEYQQINEKLTEAKARDEFILESLSTLGNLSSKKNNIEEIKKKIVELTANNFNAEYCSIGRVDEPYIYDEYVHPEVDSLSEELRSCMMEESLIGNIVANNITFHWSQSSNGDFANYIGNNYGFSLNRENFSHYNECILKSKKHNNVFIMALSHKNQNYGYIHLINFDEKFKVDDLVKFISSFEIIINNYNNLNQIIRDEKQINECYEQNDINVAINKVLKYISKEFKPDLSTFWIPIRDGILKEQKDKLLLRNFNTINNLQIETDEDKVVSYDNFITLQSNEKVTILKSGKSQLLSDLYYVKKVIIPIPISKQFKNRHKFDYWGYFIFYYTKSNVYAIESFKSRLEFIADNYRYLFERTVYGRRFRRIDKLASSVSKLNKSSESQFFESLVTLIKDVLKCEEVSIFFASEKKDYLYLKCSTADRFTNKTNGKKIQEEELTFYKKNKTKIYDLIEPDSLTSLTYSSPDSSIINNVSSSKYTNFSFMEDTTLTKRHDSLLAMQIENNKDKLGVIRCINKQVSSDNIYHNKFNEGDRELLEIITTLISPLIASMNLGAGMTESIVNIGHETRTPLSSILGDVELLEFHYQKRDISSSDIDLSFTSIRSQINLISKLISEFTSSSKSKQLSLLDIPKIKVYSFLKKVEDTFFSDLTKKSITMKIHSTSKDAKIGIDLNDLQQIIYNIIRNAVNYSFVKTTIYINHEEIEDKHVFRIRNTGIGIKQSEAEKIFIFKYRGEQAENMNIQGSGIGLHISREKAELNGGSVEVTSLTEPTEFTVKLKN